MRVLPTKADHVHTQQRVSIRTCVCAVESAPCFTAEADTIAAMHCLIRGSPRCLVNIQLLVAFATITSADATTAKPNVLFITIDDLNDWVSLGGFGGHPQAITPNMDRLSTRGILFSNAHCAAPVCGPSRNSIFTGRQPFHTGMYSNDDAGWISKHPDVLWLPQAFKKGGYETFGTGKITHRKDGGLGVFQHEYYPSQRWSPFTADMLEDPEALKWTGAELPSKGGDNPRHIIRMKGGHEYVLPLNRMPSDRSPNEAKLDSFDWGPVDVADTDMGDGKITDWAIDKLKALSNSSSNLSTPFFMCVGYYRSVCMHMHMHCNPPTNRYWGYLS